MVERFRLLSPGLGLVAAIGVLAFLANRQDVRISSAIVAILVGATVGRLAVARWPLLGPGATWASRHLLRAGVALLGIQISLGDIGSLGVGGVVVAASVVAVTLTGATLIGRRLGVSPELALLVGAGSAICGASAVAAVNGIVRSRDEQVGYAIGTVTIFGTLAMVVIPVLGSLLGLSHQDTGLWAGASIHEVGQVAGAAAAVSTTSLKAATIMKLTRVLMLAPTVAILGRQQARSEAGRAAATHPPLVPGFVLVFLGLVCLRSVHVVGAEAIADLKQTATLVLAIALAGLGTNIDPGMIRRAGPRPLALGLASWLVAAGLSLALLLALGV